MKVKLRQTSVFLCALVIGSFANASALTFEDLDPSPASFDVMPSPYMGFSFTNWLYGPDTVFWPASGVIDLFTDYADPNDPSAYVITGNNAISAPTPFIFEGATFSGYSGVTFELYLGGGLVHTSATLPDAAGAAPYGPTFLASGYNLAVDTVRVVGVQGYFAMDDFSYSAVTAVPEPSAYLMFLAGLGLAGAAARRRA